MPEDAGSIYSSLFLKLDQLDKGIIQVKTKLDQLNKTTQQKASGFASFWKNAFSTAFGVGITQLIGKVTAAVREAISVFAGFQQSMKNVQSVTNATTTEFELMQNAAKEAGETTRFTARQAADALYYLGSAGFTAQQSIAALDGVLQLAGATQSDLASTSEAVASIISQYSLEAEDATRISNVFAAAITNSQATMEKLTNSFRQVGPVAAGFGMSVEQTVGALQELYNAGFQGQQAGRGLKSVLTDLASPTANIEKIMKKYNIALESVNPTSNELVDIINTLNESGITTADTMDAFGKIAGPQMAVLIKQGGAALQKYTEDITDTNAAAEAYEIQNDSLAGSLDFLRSKLEGTAIAIFEKLEPGMRELIDSFIQFLNVIRPVGELLGNILNIFFKIVAVSTVAVTKVFDGLFNLFEKSQIPLKKVSVNFEQVRLSIEKVGKIDTTLNKLNRLNKEYENLTSKTKLSEKEQDRLRKVIAEIGKIVPEAATAFDEYGNAIELNTEKTRENAKQLFEIRRAIILEAKARLDLEKPILKQILRERGEEAKNLKERRKNLSQSAAIAEGRLAIISTFNLRYQKELKRLGGDEIKAFRNIAVRMAYDFRRVGIELAAFDSEVGFFLQDLKKLGSISMQSEEALQNLKNELAKEAQVIIEVEDARKKLEELAKLEKELAGIQKGIEEIDKIDPVDPNASDEMDELNKKTNEFWNNYRKQIKDATREAELFGNKQDILKASLDFLKSAYLELLEDGLKPTDEIMKRLRQEYDLTLLELNALIEAEKRHTEELQNKEKIEKDIIDMTADYYAKIQELGESEDKLIEIERNRALMSVYASGASEEAIEKAVEAINLYYDKLKQNSEETKEQVKITFDEMLNFAQQLAAALIGLWQTITQARLDELDKQMQAEMEAAGVAEETERERLERELEEAKKAGDKEREQEIKNEIKRLEIKEKYEKEAAMIKYKAAMQEWKFSLGAALVSLAQGIAKAIASAPLPFNLPAIAFASTLGGLQVANVIAQKPKPPEFATGGVFFGPGQQYTGDESGTPAILHNKEMILNEQQMKNLFDMVNTGEGNTGSGLTQVTVIFELDGQVIGKSVEKAQHSGTIRFKQSRLIK
jgi:TP901 family phage tail tape measure protein